MREALRRELEERRIFLENVSTSIRKILPKYPRGKIRASTSGKTIQYYHLTDKDTYSKRWGKYIRKKDRKLAEQLAQKEYDIKLLMSIDKELKKLNAYEKEINDPGPEMLYERYDPRKKELIIPKCLSKDVACRQWIEEEFTPKTFLEDTPYISGKGEKMRSKSEMLIAERLTKNGICYKYEKPLFLGNWTVHPDFTILNPKTLEEVYWEHLGMMDTEEYAQNAVRRLNLYQENGIILGDRLFVTYESSMAPLNFKVLDEMIRVLFL